MQSISLEHANQICYQGFTIIRDVQACNLEKVAEALGEIVTDPRNPEKIRDISPSYPNKANVNTLSHKHGMGAFPFHTDCAHWEKPAKYLILYCVNPGRGNRATLLIDSKGMHWTPDELMSMKNSVWKKGVKSPTLCTVIDQIDGYQFIRFDEACMFPLTEEAAKLKEVLAKKIASCRPLEVQWSCGQALIIDNHRMFHARAESKLEDPDRLLKRVLIGAQK